MESTRELKIGGAERGREVRGNAAGKSGEEASAITEGSISRSIWRLALPTWGAFVFLNLMSIVDMFFVGKLGPVAVASVAMGGIMIGVVIMLALGVEAGTTALVANAMGRNERERAGIVTGQGMLIALFLAAVLAGVGIPLAPAIIRTLGGEPEVVTAGASYLRVVSGGGVAILVTITLAAALRGAGDAITPCKAMIFANLVNAVLDPIFIFGMFGFPRLGVAGSAWATVIGRAVGMLLLLGMFVSSLKSAVPLRLRYLRPRWDTIGSICRIGIFASGRVMLRNIALVVLLRLTAMFGTAAVAAYGIGFRLQLLVLGPGKGFGTAAATMVGQNIGVRKPDRAERAGWIAAGTAMAVGLCITGGFWLAPQFIIRVFNTDAEVVAAGASLLRWWSASFPFLIVAFVLSLAMNGAGDSLRPMIITGIALVAVGIPLAYGLAKSWGEVQGIWVALFCAHVLAGLLSVVVFKRGAWRAVGLRQTESSVQAGLR